MAAFHSGAGVIGAILVAAFVGGATLAIGQIVFATVRSPAIRATVALLYAIPATIAGYSATHGLAELSMPSATWQMIFAVIGAICVGCTAFARLAMSAPPVSDRGFRFPQPRQGFRTAQGGVKHAAFGEKLLIGTLSGHF
jgi:MFS family permease